MMFTVIFAEKETIKLFEETKMFFGPLLDSKKVAFCRWSKYADSFDSMVTDLYSKIEFQKEWRAVVLSEADINKHNPFDYVQHAEDYTYSGKRDSEFYNSRRLSRFKSYEKAMNNPLLKLTTALCGGQKLKNTVADDEIYNKLVSGEITVFEYMLSRHLKEQKLNELAVRIEKYQWEKLRRFAKEKDIAELISLLRNGDACGIVKMISEDMVIDFINFLDEFSLYKDPEYTDRLIENTKKADLLKILVKDFSMRDKLPTEVICLSPRTFDFETTEQDVKWLNKDNSEYSRFAEYNLFSEKLKFVLFDVLPKDHNQYKFDQIKMMCLLLLIANNELPQGVMTANQVYRANIDFNMSIISRLCEKYISKLKATKVLLNDVEFQIVRDNVTSISDDEAHRLFESDIDIPVKLNTAFDVNELYCKYNKLGLSTDCPGSEEFYWNDQSREISRKFVRYLREPLRAIKTSVSEGFHKNNSVEDERALVLSDTQLEDVNYHLIEQEQKMIDATTTYIFNTHKFNEEIQEADSEIRRGIKQRMTKKKTIIAGAIAIAAYLFGFLPLIFGNLNTAKSITFSLTITAITAGIFLLVGFIYLFFLRKKLVNRFKHFNYVMGGICNNVAEMMSRFSKYISHACNVMRDYSVLKRRDSAVARMKKIISYHDRRIDLKIQSVYEMFSKYVNLENITISEDEAYEYDFTVVRDYDFEMPSIHSNKKIEFMQLGNEISVPIDYVESITLTREELYD